MIFSEKKKTDPFQLTTQAISVVTITCLFNNVIGPTTKHLGRTPTFDGAPAQRIPGKTQNGSCAVPTSQLSVSVQQVHSRLELF